MEKKSPKRSVRNIISLGVVSFFTDISSEMVYPLIPRLISSIGGTSVALGVIEGIAEATASVLRAFSGYISDRLKKRKALVILGYSLSALAKPLLGISKIWQMVLGFRFLDRTGKGIRTAPRDAILADSAGEKERGKWFGFHRAMDTLGAGIGPLSAFLLLGIGVPFRHLFFWAVIPAGVAVLVLIFLVREVAPERKEGEKFKLNFRGWSRHYHYYLIISGIFVLGNFSNTFLILRAQELGLKEEKFLFIPLLYLLYNLSYALISMPAGMLSDRIGRRKVLLFSFVLFALVYLGFGLNESLWALWLLFFLFGFVDGTKEGTQRALIADLVPSERRASAYGVYYAIVGALMFPSSAIAGLVWKKFGAQVVFSYGACLGLISAVLLFFLLPDQINPSQNRIK